MFISWFVDAYALDQDHIVHVCRLSYVSSNINHNNNKNKITIERNKQNNLYVFRVVKSANVIAIRVQNLCKKKTHALKWR